MRLAGTRQPFSPDVNQPLARLRRITLPTCADTLSAVRRSRALALKDVSGGPAGAAPSGRAGLQSSSACSPAALDAAAVWLGTEGAERAGGAEASFEFTGVSQPRSDKPIHAATGLRIYHSSVTPPLSVLTVCSESTNEPGTASDVLSSTNLGSKPYCALK